MQRCDEAQLLVDGANGTGLNPTYPGCSAVIRQP